MWINSWISTHIRHWSKILIFLALVCMAKDRKKSDLSNLTSTYILKPKHLQITRVYGLTCYLFPDVAESTPNDIFWQTAWNRSWAFWVCLHPWQSSWPVTWEVISWSQFLIASLLPLLQTEAGLRYRVSASSLRLWLWLRGKIGPTFPDWNEVKTKLGQQS